ncbi:iron-sulfur cluster assembly accessory protein [soil metagenome]
MTAVAEEGVQTLEVKGSCSTSVGTVKKAPIIVSERAASEVKRIVAEQGNAEPLYLRVRITGGGCSGFQPKLDLDPTVSDKLDETYEVNGINVVIDKRSALYLDEATVDFHDDLNKRGFSVKIANAKSTCGCGSSFSM